MNDEMTATAEAVRKADALIEAIKALLDLPVTVDDLRRLPEYETILRTHLRDQQKDVSELFLLIHAVVAGRESASALWAALALVGVIMDQAPEADRKAFRLAVSRAFCQMTIPTVNAV